MSRLPEENLVKTREHIGGLILRYSPKKQEPKYAIQNMGLRIEELEDALKTAVVNLRILHKESSYWDVSEALKICQEVLNIK